MTDPSAFYDALAPDYDLMTGFDGRFDAERPALRSLVERFAIRTAVDAGSGTGLHSLLLAELGVAVTAVDLSGEMIGRLRRHAAERSLPIRAEVTDLRRVHEMVGAPVDAVLSMGNTLAHLRPGGELEAALGSFRRALRPDGVLIAQLVNFDRLLERRETIQSVRERGGVTFVRFYEYDAEGIRFHLLRIRGEEYRLDTVRLSPLTERVVSTALAGAGFEEVRSCGSIALDRFDPSSSPNLVMVARRPA